MPMSLSAGDWVRMKRLRSARVYVTDIITNKDIVSRVTAANPSSPPTNLSRVVGSSKTRREASKYIDYIASQRHTYILQNEHSSNGNSTTGFGIQNSLINLCNCNKSILNSKVAGCAKCII